MRGSAITLVCVGFFFSNNFKNKNTSGLIKRTDLTDYYQRSQLRSRDVIEYLEVFGEAEDE